MGKLQLMPRLISWSRIQLLPLWVIYSTVTILSTAASLIFTISCQITCVELRYLTLVSIQLSYRCRPFLKKRGGDSLTKSASLIPSNVFTKYLSPAQNIRMINKNFLKKAMAFFPLWTSKVQATTRRHQRHKLLVVAAPVKLLQSWFLSPNISKRTQAPRKINSRWLSLGGSLRPCKFTRDCSPLSSIPKTIY